MRAGRTVRYAPADLCSLVVLRKPDVFVRNFYRFGFVHDVTDFTVQSGSRPDLTDFIYNFVDNVSAADTLVDEFIERTVYRRYVIITDHAFFQFQTLDFVFVKHARRI